MVVAKTLFGRKEIRERIVERTFNHTLVGPAVTYESGKSPTRRKQTGSMRKHAACHIVAVRTRKGQLVALGKLAGARIDAGCATHTGYTEAVEIVGRHTFLVAHGIIHTAHHAVTKTSQLQVVELKAVHVVAVVHVVVGTHFKAHGAEAVAYFRIVGVVLRTRDNRNCL